ncbi:patched domain-containing protein 3 [Procambarus clarkii]|uniref:patched domain-containing protein 3 n=1 Tax=Procambarus clarkii TaxID=6728 RepID=UPI003742E486
MGCIEWQRKFDAFLNGLFNRLGRNIANHYGYFIVVPVFITIALATGFQRISYEDDPEYLFSPTTGYARSEREVIEANFFLNFSSSFHPSRLTRSGRFARLIITAKDNGTLLRSHVWDDIVSLDRTIHSLNITVDGNKLAQYEDLCSIWDGKCLENNVLHLQNSMPFIENGTLGLSFPLMLDPVTYETYIFPYFFGGTVLDDDSVIESVQALSVYYWLRTNTQEEKEKGTRWETALLEALQDRDFGSIDVARFVSRTLETELENNTNSVVPYFVVTIVIIVVFSVCSVMMSDWVRTKPWVGLASVISAALSCFSAFGLLMYLGLKFIGINMASPFLMLGIGIDNSFVMLAAWRRTRLQDPVPVRMAETFSEAAVGITITSITDIISFYTGVVSPFPSVQIFCIYTGTAVAFTYIWNITFFGGCLALAGYMEADQRHGVTCHKVKPNSEAVTAGWWYRTFCTGGINKEDPWNTEDNQNHSFMVFFRDVVARHLNRPVIKGVVLAVFVVYMLVACWGCTMVKEGLERRKLSRDDSYSVNFYNLEDKYFREFPYRVQVVITGDVNYSNPETQKDLLDLHKKFESLPYSAGPLYTESWLRGWLSFLRINEDYLGVNITSEKDFCSALKETYLGGPANVYALDVKFNEDNSRILASRFVIQTHNIRDANADKDMMEAFRKVAFESKFKVTVYNVFFIYFDQYVLVRTTSIQDICIAAFIMLFISLIFIPNPLCSIWVAFSIASIEVGVVGYMALWGVNLDSISMINLIMCIGFSVDFTAHISYAYIAAKVRTREERVQECLYSLGVPIIQGGLSTILGVAALILAPSYIFITFFKTVFLVIVFGVLHGLFLLPVLLSLLGPGTCKKTKADDDTSSSPSTTVDTCQGDPSEPQILQPQPVTIVNRDTIVYHASSENSEDGGDRSSTSGVSLDSRSSKDDKRLCDETDSIQVPEQSNGLPILEVYSNMGYVSDDLDGEEDVQRSQSEASAGR